MIKRLKSVDSTNCYGLREFVDLSDNTLITADAQDSGHGRRGREWFSPENKNIYASYIIKDPKFPVGTSLWICGLAALKTLREACDGLDLWLKWPNDVYCTPRGNPDKYLKIAGLLAETHSIKNSNKIDGVVAGLGININMNEKDFQNIDQPATSLYIETEEIVDISEFAVKLLENLLFYRKKGEADMNSLYDEWRSENGLLGQNITLQQDGVTISGEVTDVTRTGELILSGPDGVSKRIMSGDLIRIQK